MAKNYKYELRKESLEFRAEFEGIDTQEKYVDSDSESGSDSGSESSYRFQQSKTVVRKLFCLVVGNTEYKLKLEMKNQYHGSDDLEIKFDILPQGVSNLTISELFLKVQGERGDGGESDYSDEPHEGTFSTYEKIGTMHSKEFSNVYQNDNYWQCKFKDHELKGFELDRDRISGWFVFSFETSKPLRNLRDFHAKTMKHFSIFNPPIGDFDCEIIAEEKHFKFHKSYLCQMSEVFQKMFEHPGTVEYQTGKVNCKGFARETLKRFHNLLYKQNLVKEDITTELIKFADKYMINTLYSFCLEHFRDHVTEANLIELIKMGTFKNDDLLLEGCAEYIRTTHKRHFFKTKEWTTFTAKNPECTTMIMNSM